jgi:hypothetical protein
LKELAEQWDEIVQRPLAPQKIVQLPGMLEWIRKPDREPGQLLYLIWRGPWMTVSAHTYIGSMLSHLGFADRLPSFPERYPKIDLAHFDPEKTVLLFSSEPYPFGQKKRELLSLDFPSALVDGEAFSWFGLRGLRFLQSLRN